MTKKYFWHDPYLTRHLTTITAVSGAEVILDSTILFAFSGGQESDHGTIAGHPVLNARKDGQDIIYTLPQDHSLKTGNTVELELDWDRRYRLMRLHFAAELILEIAYRSLQGIEKVGAHISADKARIDFVLANSIAPFLPQFSTEANQIISNDLPITCAFNDEQNERRYWEIEGFSKVPCGGTHVKKTGEIGPIRLKRNNIGRGKERIEIYIEQSLEISIA